MLGFGQQKTCTQLAITFTFNSQLDDYGSQRCSQPIKFEGQTEMREDNT